MQNLYHAPDRSDLIRCLGTITPDTPRQWGRMSAHQMICHLSDTLRLSLGERTVTPNGNLIAHTVVKTICLRTPIPWPKGVKSSPELAAEQNGTPAGEFRTDFDELVGLIERHAEHDADRWPDHPFFGPMDRWSWGRFHYRHIRHHLRQFGAWRIAPAPAPLERVG